MTPEEKASLRDVKNLLLDRNFEFFEIYLQDVGEITSGWGKGHCLITNADPTDIGVIRFFCRSRYLNIYINSKLNNLWDDRLKLQISRLPEPITPTQCPESVTAVSNLHYIAFQFPNIIAKIVRYCDTETKSNLLRSSPYIQLVMNTIRFKESLYLITTIMSLKKQSIKKSQPRNFRWAS